MSEQGREIEAKFYLHDHTPVRRRLKALGASLLSERHREHNLSFDTPDGRLKAAREVLRLRQDDQAHLTFKRRLDRPEERLETEIVVKDFEATKALVEALGYQVVAAYEKFRETYSLGPVEVMLDELPFGRFVEIEGASVQDLKEAAASLGLAWDRRLPETYLALFDGLRRKLQLPFIEATFDNFADRAPITARDLGAQDSLIDTAPIEGKP